MWYSCVTLVRLLRKEPCCEKFRLCPLCFALGAASKLKTLPFPELCCVWPADFLLLPWTHLITAEVWQLLGWLFLLLLDLFCSFCLGPVALCFLSVSVWPLPALLQAPGCGVANCAAPWY